MQASKGKISSWMLFRVWPSLGNLATVADHIRHVVVSFHITRRFELEAGKIDAARRVFLRAVRQCPGCKQLWLEGLQAVGSDMMTNKPAAADVTQPDSTAAAAPAPTSATGKVVRPGVAAISGRAVAGGLTPREVSELMNLMSEKGVRLHTDVVEIVMSSLEQ